MSKDEYLITDPPLKALTVFAMPMILGSFFQQVYNMADSIIVGQFVGSSALAAVGACCTDQCFYLCGAWCWCGRRCACKPLFWCKKLWQNENHCVNVPDQLFDLKRCPWCLWLLLFPFHDERITDPCRYIGRSSIVSACLLCGFPVSIHVQHSFHHVHFHR